MVKTVCNVVLFIVDNCFNISDNISYENESRYGMKKYFKLIIIWFLFVIVDL